MSQLIVNDIKKIVSEYLAASQMTDIQEGTVTSASPLEIQGDVNMEPYYTECLIVPKPVGGGGGSLSVGDTVLLLSCQGGQKKVVLGTL